MSNAVGASTWIWVSPLTDERLAELAPHVRGLGFDVIELQVEVPGQWDPALAAELASAHGLATSLCCVMGADRDLSVADPGVVGPTQDYLRGCIEVAERIGSGVVAGPMYAPVGRLWRLAPGERRATVARVAEALRPLAEHAGERGVRLAVEPLNRYETSLLNTVEQGLELVELVDSQACGLLLDTYHLNIEETDPPAAATAAGSRIAHVHACGTDRGAPGGDRFAWGDFATALRAAAYEGAVCIESFTPEQETIATAAAIWRPLAASPDALAADGLRFLREALAR
ncbi:MAG: TIM barrel protein [Solirubrobacterales bacterium]|nr:TIM barrel protein [Solirubrobacterales bacterium]